MTKCVFYTGLWACILFGVQTVKAQDNGLLQNPFPEAKREVRAVLDEIEQSVRDNDMDRLIAFHAYGPKFTEFKNGERRSGPEQNEKFEREFIGSFTRVDKWEWDDLKIAVFGDVANVTFHADFVPWIGEEKLHMTGQFTILFVKTPAGWKIVHEHMSPISPEG
ncbi:nuclear transport factor 2 family protein [Robiginitalea sp. SC105]|uniref:YybH family protein n=1 Tax=Robiginitalea sp. SC105 TaxID=2762332 RepID=UPI00163A46AE|nr:nuclear transport factor 2 family protein [Robiginitalea sp. SC105]MBC2838772.1 DUF3225 domain-containing protein [Robiginitalea sp. SC105]